VFSAALFKIWVCQNSCRKFQHKLIHYLVNKLKATGTLLDKSQIGNKLCWQRHWTTLVLDLHCYQENLFTGAGERCLENICLKGHTFVKTVIIQDNSSLCIKGTWSSCKNTYFNQFLQSLIVGEPSL
jgi:hypothetical protein